MCCYLWGTKEEITEVEEGLGKHWGQVVRQVHVGKASSAGLVEVQHTLHKEPVIALIQPMQR